MRDFTAPSGNHCEILPHDRNLQVQKFEEGAALKESGTKNMQNLARYRMTPNFNSKYL